MARHFSSQLKQLSKQPLQGEIKVSMLLLKRQKKFLILFLFRREKRKNNNIR